MEMEALEDQMATVPDLSEIIDMDVVKSLADEMPMKIEELTTTIKELTSTVSKTLDQEDRINLNHKHKQRSNKMKQKSDKWRKLESSSKIRCGCKFWKNSERKNYWTKKIWQNLWRESNNKEKFQVKIKTLNLNIMKMYIPQLDYF